MSFAKRDQNKQKSPAKRFLFILGLGMFTLYFILGIIIIFWEEFPIEMEMGYRIAFGVLLIAYSFIRFVRLLRS